MKWMKLFGGVVVTENLYFLNLLKIKRKSFIIKRNLVENEADNKKNRFLLLFSFDFRPLLLATNFFLINICFA